MDNDNDVIVRVARASAAAATAASHADWTSIRRTSTSRIEAVRFIVRSTSSLEGERGGRAGEVASSENYPRRGKDLVDERNLIGTSSPGQRRGGTGSSRAYRRYAPVQAESFRLHPKSRRLRHVRDVRARHAPIRERREVRSLPDVPRGRCRGLPVPRRRVRVVRVEDPLSRGSARARRAEPGSVLDGYEASDDIVARPSRARVRGMGVSGIPKLRQRHDRTRDLITREISRRNLKNCSGKRQRHRDRSRQGLPLRLRGSTATATGDFAFKFINIAVFQRENGNGGLINYL
jgi:hypothetical protein